MPGFYYLNSRLKIILPRYRKHYLMQNNKSSRKISECKSERSRNEVDSSICVSSREFYCRVLNVQNAFGGRREKKFDWPTIYDIDVEKIKVDNVM